MRRLLPLALLVAGCQDYGKLEDDFCKTAVHVGASECADFEYTLWDTPELMPVTTGGGTLTIERYAGPDTTGPGVFRYMGRHYASATARGNSGYDDPSNAYRGTGALWVQLPAGPPASALMSAALPEAPTNGAVAVRFFVYTGNNPPPGTFEMVRWTSADGSTVRTLGYDEGALRITDGLSGRTASTGTPLSATSWHCIEIDYDGTNVGTKDAPLYQTTGMTVAVDQQVRASLPALPDAGGAGTLEIGPNRTAGAGAAVQLWMDETIVADGFIGCTL